MDATVTEIAPDIFRINVAPETARISFSCFLVRDERPAMIETGFDNLYGMFPAVREAVAALIDVSTLRYIFIPHVEADECGSLNRFLDLAPEAEVLCSPVGAAITVPDVASRRPRGLSHGEKVNLGRKTLSAVITPWVHYWDSMLVHDETDRVLFTSDLFGNGGAAPMTNEDLSEQIVAASRMSGLFPSQKHLERGIDRIEGLPVDVIACHHGCVLEGDPTRYYRALKDNPVGDITDSPMYDTPR
jgi:flavorubredoxin